MPRFKSPLQRYLFSPRARSVWTALLLALAVGTFVKAVSPLDEIPLSLGWDKADHMLAFCALALVGTIALHGWRQGRWWLVLGLFALGALIEVVQLFVPGRNGDWQDLLADSLGIVVGLAVGSLFAKRFERRTKPRDATHSVHSSRH